MTSRKKRGAKEKAKGEYIFCFHVSTKRNSMTLFSSS
ncbi:unnamed protein product [Brassica rapa subsp. trilocularis]